MEDHKPRHLSDTAKKLIALIMMGAVIIFVFVPVITVFIFMGTAPEYLDAGTPVHSAAGPVDLQVTWDAIQESSSFITFRERHGPCNLTFVYLEMDAQSGSTTWIEYIGLATDGYRATILSVETPTFRILEGQPYTGQAHDLTPYLAAFDAYGLLEYVQRAWEFHNSSYAEENYVILTLSMISTQDPYVYIELYAGNQNSRTGHGNNAAFWINGSLVT